MLRNAFGVVLVFVVMIAGVGPAAATAQPAGPAQAPSTVGPDPALGSVSPQVAGQNCSFPVTATDATGTEVTVEEEPETVAALGASTAQTIWDIGAKGKVVGMPVDSTTAYLNGSQNRTGIFQSDGFTVATERVVGLDPDLVLAANVIPNETVQKLRGAGLTVYKFDFGGSLSDIYRKTNQTGRLVGTCDGATQTVADTKGRVNAVRDAVADEDRPRVLYAQGDGFVAGNGTFIDDVLEAAGGDNLAADVGIEGYKQISNETVAERDPQWIIASDASFIPTGQAYAGTTALSRNQTLGLDTTLLSQPGPRVVGPLTEIARTLHPEAMQRANLSNATTRPPMAADGGNATDTTGAATADATAMETAGAAGATTVGEAATDGATTVADAEGTAADTDRAGNATGGDGGDASGETTSSNGPGFGVTGAAIALLGAALLARRRS